MNTNQDKIAKLESIITLLSQKIDKQRKSSDEFLSQSMIDEREEAYSQKN